MRFVYHNRRLLAIPVLYRLAVFCFAYRDGVRIACRALRDGASVKVSLPAGYIIEAPHDAVVGSDWDSANSLPTCS